MLCHLWLTKVCCKITHWLMPTHLMSVCVCLSATCSSCTNEVIQDELYQGPGEPINQECVVFPPCMHECVCEGTGCETETETCRTHNGCISLNVTSHCLTIWEPVLPTFSQLLLLEDPSSICALTHTYTHTLSASYSSVWLLDALSPQSISFLLLLPSS